MNDHQKEIYRYQLDQIAADRFHNQMRKSRAKHELSAQTGRSDHAACRHAFKRVIAVAHKSIPRVFTLTHSYQHKTFGQLHRHIL